jgi:hypothetical protein
MIPLRNGSELVGKPIGSLPGETVIGRYGRPLSLGKEYSVEYRRLGNDRVVMLLKTKHLFPEAGDRIRSAVTIPTDLKAYPINIHCRWKHRLESIEEAIVGVMEDHEKPGYFTPKASWLIDLRIETITPVDPGEVECGVFSEE